MKYKLYKEDVFLTDIPEKNLKKRDIATVVGSHPSTSSENGYTLEVFNAISDWIAVVTVPASGIEELKETEISADVVYEAA